MEAVSDEENMPTFTSSLSGRREGFLFLFSHWLGAHFVRFCDPTNSLGRFLVDNVLLCSELGSIGNEIVDCGYPIEY